MDPVPYEIRDDDIDEVLSAWGQDWPQETRDEARRHVLRRVTELDEIVRTAAEDPHRGAAAERAGPLGERPGDRAPDRREAALAAIEDLLIRDGFIEVSVDDRRAFPVTDAHETERDDS